MPEVDPSLVVVSGSVSEVPSKSLMSMDDESNCVLPLSLSTKSRIGISRSRSSSSSNPSWFNSLCDLVQFGPVIVIFAIICIYIIHVEFKLSTVNH